MGKNYQLIKMPPVLLESLAIALLGMLVLIWGSKVFATGPIKHPLDPLTAREYETVVSVLEKENHTDSNSRYSLITLDQPAKAKVLTWRPGDALPRDAFVIVRNDTETFEGVIDITGAKVVSWKQIDGVQPGILLSEEWINAQQIVRSNKNWQAAIRKRGINNFNDVICIPHTVGYFGIEEDKRRRLVKVSCYDSRMTKNFWVRPIEGLIVVVDHDKKKVVKLIDTGVVAIPKAPIDIEKDSVGDLRNPPKPISIVQSQRKNFKISGQVVTWDPWQFHFHIDPRLGLVLSLVHYNDRGKMRSIIYQGFVSELFVPYMDPSVGWYFRTYMDVGEYGLGKLASQLQPGLDCPSNAMFFEAVFADDWGDPYTQSNAACVFERDTGDIAWRHYEPVYGQTVVRTRTELVLRFISTIGSYDYLFDWVFHQDGTIKVALGATGITQVKAIKSRSTADKKSTRETAYGRMVAEHTVAINHDHFFSYRIDLDIDGPQNSFLHEVLKSKRLEHQNPRTSVWVVEPRTLATEQAAKLRINIEQPALWRVINPNVTGPLGYPVSYQLKPKTNAVSLLNPDDFPQRRAGFTDFHLWVTPYKQQERYAAGTYPNQSQGGDGLPRWTSANRPIHNTDIVLWYTLGLHHVVRSEDWPVMPTVWTEFELSPFDFFPHNPVFNLPE